MHEKGNYKKNNNMNPIPQFCDYCPVPISSKGAVVCTPTYILTLIKMCHVVRVTLWSANSDTYKFSRMLMRKKGPNLRVNCLL